MSIDPVAFSIALVAFVCGAVIALAWVSCRKPKQDEADSGAQIKRGGGAPQEPL